jgi:hypothetical protein
LLRAFPFKTLQNPSKPFKPASVIPVSNRNLRVLPSHHRQWYAEPVAQAPHRLVDSHRTHLIDKLDLGGANELIRLAAILAAEA